MLKSQISLLLLIYIPNSLCIVGTMFKAGKEVWTLFQLIDTVSLNCHYSSKNFYEMFSNDSSRKIKNQLDVIHDQLDQIGSSIDFKKVTDSLKASSSEIMIHTLTDVFDLSIRSIDESYNEFHKHMNDRSHQSFQSLRELLGNIALKIKGEIVWIRKIITETHEFLPKHKNLVEAISGYGIDQVARMCDGGQLFSEILINLYKKAVLAELKINVIIALANVYEYHQNQAWKMMNLFEKGNFVKQFSKILEIFSWNMGIVDSLYLRSCDPTNATWLRNENFVELEDTFHKTIFRYHWGICKYGSCNDINYVKSRCEPDIYDPRTACMGISGNCIYLSAITACVLRKGPYRFQFVNSTKLGSLGTNFECPKDNGYLINDGVGWNSSFAACACNCQSKENRISLELVESAVRLNRIITGLRFVRLGHILYIQPKESLLSENGRVRLASRWIAISIVSDKSQLHSIDRMNKTFFLDDLRLPFGYALTGVKFNKVVRGDLHGFALEIFGLPFDYESGKLDIASEAGISRRASDEEPGVGIDFVAKDSIHTKLVHEPSSSNFKYVTLKRSLLKYDFGQKTLPFFDAVPVVTRPASLLGGVGMFHKGVDGYAGLISFRLYGIDYVRYFSDFQSKRMENDKVLFESV